MYTIACVNQKGGVGKTATTANAAAALAQLGRRVLVVDLDPQGHLTSALRLAEAPDGDDAANLARALTGAWRGDAAELVTAYQHAPAPGAVDVITTSYDMFTVGRDLDRLRAREQRLERVLDGLAGDYDVCLIDCPPALDILTDNALVAADGVLIPVEAEDSTVKALRLLLAQIAAIEDDLRETRLTLDGMVVSRLRYVGRSMSTIASSTLAELRTVGIPIVATVPLGVAVTEAWRLGRPVIDYAPDSDQAAAYRAIAEHIDSRVEAAG